MKIVKYALLLLFAMLQVPPVTFADQVKADIVAVNLGDAVIPGKPTTYLDLAREYVSDLHLENGRYLGDTVEPQPGDDGDSLDGPVALGSAKRIDISPGGRRQMVLYLAFNETSKEGDDFSLLALYDLDHGVSLRPVDVTFFESTAFAEPPLFRLSGGYKLLLLQHSWQDSSEDFAYNGLILARQDKLETVAYYLTLKTSNCAGVMEQLPSYRLLPTEAKGVPETIELTVDVKAKESGSKCGETLWMKSHKIVVQFRWDQKLDRYVPSSDALDRLQDEILKER